MVLKTLLAAFAMGLTGLATSAPLSERAIPSTYYYFSFGDSWTTTGFNIYGPQPSPGNPMGNPPTGTYYTSTGGLNYVGYLTQKYNSTFVQAYDFGVGGARADQNFSTQVDWFTPKYTSPKFWTADNAFFSIFFGINDIGLRVYTPQGPGDINTQIPYILNIYFQNVERLYQAGARRFMFVGVPPMDQSPLAKTASAEVQQTHAKWINEFNGQLAYRVNQWTAAHAGAVSAIYDYHVWMYGILINPVGSGFPDSTCINSDGKSCIWWDWYHSSSKLNDLVAARMQTAMNSIGFNGSVPKGGYFN